MSDSYFEGDYFEDDYFEGDDTLAITPLPDPPSRSDSPAEFIAKANAWAAAFNQLALEIDAVATAMSLNAVTSTSVTSMSISVASKTFTVENGKSYVVGMTVKIACTAQPLNWMLGTVTAYNSGTGSMTVSISETLGSGTYAGWTVSLGFTGGSSSGSLTQDFSVKTLIHANGSTVASASTINLSNVTGQIVHISGTTQINAATMTPGKDVWVIFDGALTLGYNATTHKTNGAGASINVASGDMAFYTSDGTVVRVIVHRSNGKAIIETSAPAGLPIGTIIAFAAGTAPTGYLACPTSATNISRTTYAALRAVLGDTWGAGDGSTTFGMPYFPANWTMIQQSAGNVGSSMSGSIKAHTHDFTIVPTTGSGSVPSAGTASGANVTNTTASTGGTDNLAAGMRVLLCVKYA